MASLSSYEKVASVEERLPQHKISSAPAEEDRRQGRLLLDEKATGETTFIVNVVNIDGKEKVRRDVPMLEVHTLHCQ